jgi:hypothetical protein
MNEGIDRKLLDSQERPQPKAEQTEQVPQFAKDWLAMMGGALVIGAGLGVAKEVWKAKGGKIKEAGGGLLDHIIDGCVSKAKEKVNEALGANQQELRTGNARFVEATVTEPKNSRQERTQPPKNPSEDLRKGAIDVEFEEVTDTPKSERTQEKTPESDPFGDLLNKDADLRKKFEGLSAENERISEEFIKGIPKEKQGKAAFLIMEILMYEQELQKTTVESEIPATAEKETVSAKDYEVVKAELIRQKEISNKLQWKFAQMMMG